MIILSGETSILGNCSASLSAKAQWVVARRPSISPVSARTNAPAQIEQTVTPRACWDASHCDAGLMLCIFSGMMMLGGAIT
ncbi:hypothetical protein D3C72_1917970 [compost metagenome]